MEYNHEISDGWKTNKKQYYFSIIQSAKRYNIEYKLMFALFRLPYTLTDPDVDNNKIYYS